jgi:hypothetical protein
LEYINYHWKLIVNYSVRVFKFSGRFWHLSYRHLVLIGVKISLAVFQEVTNHLNQLAAVVAVICPGFQTMPQDC